MKKVKLVAIKIFPYLGRDLTPGDEFDAASIDDARILKQAGNARDPDKPRAKYETKVESAATTAPLASKDRYNRRDMQAES